MSDRRYIVVKDANEHLVSINLDKIVMIVARDAADRHCWIHMQDDCTKMVNISLHELMDLMHVDCRLEKGI